MVPYLKATLTEKRSPERDHYIVSRLRECFGGKDLRTLSPKDIRAYIEHRQASDIGPATINRELGLLSAALKLGEAPSGVAASQPGDWTVVAGAGGPPPVA